MEGHQDLRGRVPVVRVEVDDEGEKSDRCEREHPLARAELSSTGEVRGEEREHEDAEVPDEPGWLVLREPGREPRDLDRDRCREGEPERLDPSAGRARPFVLARDE